jgi:translation initiation factor IF-1
VQKSELIRLDARLLDVIDHAVFHAELANGHRFVAIAKDGQGRPLEQVKVSDTVTVEMSPFDMSQGRVVVCPALSDEVDHEGEKFSQENV